MFLLQGSADKRNDVKMDQGTSTQALRYNQGIMAISTLV